MAVPNLQLRGSTYWWRRKVTIDRQIVSVALSPRTGNSGGRSHFAILLGAEVEKLRMAYGETGVAIDHKTLKGIFSDALRWQLDRIPSDQAGSAAPRDEHAQANRLRLDGELWRLYAREGSEAEWTANEEARLAKEGWSKAERGALNLLWQRARNRKSIISDHQIAAYREHFGFADTESNMDRVRRAIYAARAEACDEATKRLGSDPGDFGAWLTDAMADETPFAWARRAGIPVDQPEDTSRPARPDTSDLGRLTDRGSCSRPPPSSASRAISGRSRGMQIPSARCARLRGCLISLLAGMCRSKI